MSAERFAASGKTTARWRRRQRHLLLFSIPFAIIVVIEVLSVRGGWLETALGITVALACAIIVGYIAIWAAQHGRTQGSKWSGYGYLDFFVLRDAGLSDAAACKSDRRLRLWTLGRGVVGGRMDVRAEGLSWRFGALARIAGVRGMTLLPWNTLRDIEIGKVPGTVIRGSGGGISMELANGTILDGQFFGSREELLRVLGESPLATKSS